MVIGSGDLKPGRLIPERSHFAEAESNTCLYEPIIFAVDCLILHLSTLPSASDPV